MRLEFGELQSHIQMDLISIASNQVADPGHWILDDVVKEWTKRSRALSRKQVLDYTPEMKGEGG